MNSFNSKINDKKFKSNFKELLGDKNKRIPSEFKEVFLTEPLIANKQFYFTKKLDTKHITSHNLIKTIVDLYHVGKPVVNFLKIGIRQN